MEPKPTYLDWQFWTAVTSIIAIILSQIPPLRVFFKKKMLTVEKHGLITLSHRIGSPTMGIFLILQNEGGRTINVKSIELNVVKDKRESFKLVGKGYFKESSDTNSTLLTPFSINVGESWRHSVFFYEDWSRKKQTEYRKLESAVRDHIQAQSLGSEKLHEAKPEDVQSLINIFERSFKWEPAEYEVQLKVLGDQGDLIAQDSFNFVLFDSDSEELASYHKQYKYGDGVYYYSNKLPGVSIDIS
ncbi:hypothetical protein [Pseudoalteromonas luteoviolacea]|uniref:Uncharacterized protein n=1 Tax=Pseudoalteromonas luteoviolacea (strain 2ta16) TaxID=1353533 RepID=V4HW54_PSEL2|nr:hypothetical protein [Pseudoalteromonas luteoviolacea]ESP95045.1 hypothetical protein PL2TA16_04601 [Pseudoalteromonas luteoviolacea 2ta16]KZN34156.1 hypothetical protein N483_25420 [Pseudoalteromonas luteoviolacea NCIMB 1944]